MKGCRFAGEGAGWFQPELERERDAAGQAHPSDCATWASAAGRRAGHGMRVDNLRTGIDGGAELLQWSLLVLPVGCLLPNYWGIVFITVLTLFLTLFFSRLHFHSLINFGIFLTVYNPCHGCHGNRRECAQR